MKRNSIRLRTRRWGGGLLDSLLQHFQSLIEAVAQVRCGHRAATQMCALDYVDRDARTVWHQDVRGQFDLNSPTMSSHTGNEVEIDEGSLLGTGRGYLNSWRCGGRIWRI